jgi:hypothetical protein
MDSENGLPSSRVQIAARSSLFALMMSDHFRIKKRRSLAGTFLYDWKTL